MDGLALKVGIPPTYILYGAVVLEKRLIIKFFLSLLDMARI